jgi:hypothetical protein
VVTNGYFATTVEDAEFWLRPLKEAGLTSLSVSDDDFHSLASERISAGERAVEAAHRLGISVGTICIQPPLTAHEAHSKGMPIEGGEVRFRGRAVEKLITDALPRQNWDSFGECPDEDFREIGRLHLDPFGWLYPCQGVAVGNLTQRSLARIVAEYDPEKRAIIGPILRGGPAQLVREHHLPLEGRYVDACHLCYTARQSLRPKFPEDLAPPEVYGTPS